MVTAIAYSWYAMEILEDLKQHFSAAVRFQKKVITTLERKEVLRPPSLLETTNQPDAGHLTSSVECVTPAKFTCNLLHPIGPILQ